MLVGNVLPPSSWESELDYLPLRLMGFGAKAGLARIRLSRPLLALGTLPNLSAPASRCVKLRGGKKHLSRASRGVKGPNPGPRIG